MGMNKGVQYNSSANIRVKNIMLSLVLFLYKFPNLYIEKRNETCDNFFQHQKKKTITAELLWLFL